MVNFEEWEPNTEEAVDIQEQDVSRLFGVYNEEVFMEYLVKKNEKCPGYSIPALTHHCKGHQPGTITLITAPSGCGKTMFCVQEMITDINSGNDVIYVSFENSQMMIYDSIYQSCLENKVEMKRICEHVHYIEWYTFLTSPSKINYIKQHNIKSLYIDYIAGDLFNSPEAYGAQQQMLGFLRNLHKSAEECGIYICIFAQQLPTEERVDIYDGSYIQSCKSLHQPVDVYLSIRKPHPDYLTNWQNKGCRSAPNRIIQVVKNRLGTRRNCFNIPVEFIMTTKSFIEVGEAMYYGGEDVAE